jgi:hypothetical protein
LRVYLLIVLYFSGSYVHIVWYENRFLSLLRITMKRKALPDAMKPRKEGLIKDIKPDETRSPHSYLTHSCGNQH